MPLSSGLKTKSERGQALVIIGVSLIVLAGLIGLVVDGGNAYLDRRNAQNAADSAALAGALIRVRGGQSPVQAALDAAAKNGYSNDGVNNTVTVHIPPVSGPNEGNSEYIQVIIRSRVKTYISNVVGVSEITNEVQAVARSKPSELKQILNGVALISLAPNSNCTSERAFWLHDEVSMNISGGSVFINSNNENCALMQEGVSKLNLDASYRINVVGGASLQKAQFLSPGVVVGQVPIGYPPPFFMPEIECGDVDAAISEDGTTMSPGNWGKDDFPPEKVTTLEPGIYCIEGDFVVGDGQSLTGTDVIINVKNGEVKFSSKSSILLDAPSEGDYYGLLIFLPIENNNRVVLDGEKGSILEGTILAPGAKIQIVASNPKREYHSQIIGYTIELTGRHKIDIMYKNNQNFDSFSMPEVQLSQ